MCKSAFDLILYVQIYFWFGFICVDVVSIYFFCVLSIWFCLCRGGTLETSVPSPSRSLDLKLKKKNDRDGGRGVNLYRKWGSPQGLPCLVPHRREFFPRKDRDEDKYFLPDMAGTGMGILSPLGSPRSEEITKLLLYFKKA